MLVTGGYNNSGYSASAEVYDPALGTWAATGSLATGRYPHTATLLPNGKVLVTVGNSADVYVYGSSVQATWTSTGPLATAREYHTATLLPNGKVLVAGGNGAEGPPKNVEVYDPAQGTWTATSPLTIQRYYHTATLLPNGKVLVT
ncbi:MAG: kelch-like protein, partial [Mycobacteriaceae bacterium]|nr:kelch-like protein [Mycobacteriaceae bacterium]